MPAQTPPKFEWPGKKGALVQIANCFSQAGFHPAGLSSQPGTAEGVAPGQAPMPKPGM